MLSMSCSDLPEEWRTETHDLTLLQAVAKEGFYVRDLFVDDFKIDRKKLMKRLEQLC